MAIFCCLTLAWKTVKDEYIFISRSCPLCSKEVKTYVSVIGLWHLHSAAPSCVLWFMAVRMLLRLSQAWWMCLEFWMIGGVWVLYLYVDLGGGFEILYMVLIFVYQWIYFFVFVHEINSKLYSGVYFNVGRRQKSLSVTVILLILLVVLSSMFTCT